MQEGKIELLKKIADVLSKYGFMVLWGQKTNEVVLTRVRLGPYNDMQTLQTIYASLCTSKERARSTLHIMALSSTLRKASADAAELRHNKERCGM